METKTWIYICVAVGLFSVNIIITIVALAQLFECRNNAESECKCVELPRDDRNQPNQPNNPAQPTEPAATDPPLIDCYPRFTDSKYYAGDIAIAANGDECIPWLELEGAFGFETYVVAQNFPDESVAAAGNKCRNPSGDRGGVWCAARSRSGEVQHEFCNIDECEEDVDDCAFDRCLNGSTCIDASYGFWCNCRSGFTGTLCQLPDERCTIRPYTGDLAMSESGDPCIPWELVVPLIPSGLTLNMFVRGHDTSWEEVGAKCRDPFGYGREACIVVQGRSIVLQPCGLNSETC